MKITNNIVEVLLGLVLYVLNVPVVSAIYYTDSTSFDADNPGLTLYDFEDIASPSTGLFGYNPSMTPGVLLSGFNPWIIDSSVCGAPSDHFSLTMFGAPLSMTFSPSVTSVGFNIAIDGDVDQYQCGGSGVEGNVIAKIYSGTTLVDTQTFTTESLSTFNTFVGWSDLGSIDELTLELTAYGDFISIDNLRFGTVIEQVPEPAALVLFITGLLGVSRLRKQD